SWRRRHRRFQPCRWYEKGDSIQEAALYHKARGKEHGSERERGALVPLTEKAFPCSWRRVLQRARRVARVPRT
ncbi:MAG: hypothetical protein LBT01_05980, partial [Spirochaetaceae bacterium]|nr:hypothetical protein [Spirochaetaceae bacterium]